MATTVVSIKSVQSGISEWLTACADRVNLIDGYLNRVVKQDYINAQRDRFDSENSGEDFLGGRWQGLDSKYSEYKKRVFSSYPGSGAKLNVRTSNLMQSLLLSDTFYPSPAPKKIKAKNKGEQMAGSLAVVDAASIHIYTLVPYAEHVDEVRTFSSWSPFFWKRINRGIMNYLAGKDG